MVILKRGDSSDEGFQKLIKELDKVLRSRYNQVQNQYDQYNKVDTIRNVVVAYIGEQPVGCGCFKKFDHSSVEIKRMFVSEDHRGKGIAESILKELERWAKELSYHHTVLETGVKLPEAMRLYQKYHYVITENYGQYIGMENSVCMRKDLGEAPYET